MISPAHLCMYVSLSLSLSLRHHCLLPVCVNAIGYCVLRQWRTATTTTTTTAAAAAIQVSGQRAVSHDIIALVCMCVCVCVHHHYHHHHHHHSKTQRIR